MFKPFTMRANVRKKYGQVTEGLVEIKIGTPHRVQIVCTDSLDSPPYGGSTSMITSLCATEAETLGRTLLAVAKHLRERSEK